MKDLGTAGVLFVSLGVIISGTAEEGKVLTDPPTEREFRCSTFAVRNPTSLVTGKKLIIVLVAVTFVLESVTLVVIRRVSIWE